MRRENAFYFQLIEKALPELPTDVEIKHITQEVDQPQDTEVAETASEQEERYDYRGITGLLSWLVSGHKKQEEPSDGAVANGEVVAVKQEIGKKAASSVADGGESKASVKFKQTNRQGVTQKQQRPQHQHAPTQTQSKQQAKQEQQLQEQQQLLRVVEQQNKEMKSQGDNHHPVPSQSHKHTEQEASCRAASASGQAKGVVKKSEDEKKAVSVTLPANDRRKVSEVDLERQLAELTVSERRLRDENERLKASNEEAGQQMDVLRKKVQHGGEELLTLDKKLRGEQEARQNIQWELQTQRNRSVSSEELKRVTRALAENGEIIKRVEMEKQSLERQLAQTKENSKKEIDLLMSALSAIQEKNTHLENSLSAETRIKLDLFSALGDAKRKITMAEDELGANDKVCASLEKRIAELMALLPPSAIEREKDMQMEGRMSTRTFHSEDSTY